MPIDPNIALTVKPVEIADPLAQYGKVAAIQNAQNQNALAQFQLGAAQRAEEDQQTIRNAMAGVKYGTPEYEAAITGAYAKTGNLKGLQDYQKTKAEQEKLTAEVALKKQELHRANLGNLAMNPSDENIKAHLQDGVIKREITEDQALAQWQQLAPMNFQQRVKFFNNAAMTADQRVGHEVTMRGQNLVDARARENIQIAQQRENRLAQGPIGTTLTAEQNDALFGENGAVARGAINPNRINSRNAKMWADAFLRNPSADPVKVAQDVAAADKAIKDFGTGEQGKKVTSFNTAIDHLDTLDKLGAALKSGDIKLFNSIANGLGVQTGGSAATMYNQAARIVGGEVSKAIVPGVGTGKEREETAAAFSSAMSPEQLAGASATAKKLLGGQLNSLELQYKRTTKRDDFADQFLSPAAKAAYQSSRAAPAAPAPAATQSGATVSNW